MIPKLFCWLLGHRVEVVQFFGQDATRFACDRCGGQFIRKNRGEFAGFVLTWDDDFAELYTMLGYPIRKWEASKP